MELAYFSPHSLIPEHPLRLSYSGSCLLSPSAHLNVPFLSSDLNGCLGEA